MSDNIFEGKDNNVTSLTVVDGGSLDEYVNSLTPSKCMTWDYTKSEFVEISDPFKREEHEGKALLAIDAFKHIVGCVKGMVGNLYELCYYLNIAYDHYKYIAGEYRDSDLHDYGMSESNFTDFIARLGLSKSTAYRYRDIGIAVDINTKQFKAGFEGYSFTLMSELVSLCRSRYCAVNYDYLIRLTEIVPATTTIEEITKYKKIMNLRAKCEEPFSLYSGEDCSLTDKIFKSTPLPDVLKIYGEWEQENAKKQLEDTMSEKKTSSDPTPEYDETINSLRQEIKKLQLGYVPSLGMCEGCVYKGVNLNKCRCCRRNKDMKDLFQHK